MISKFIEELVKRGQWLLCCLKSKCGLPGKPEIMSWLSRDVFHLVKVRAEFFYPDKTLPRHKWTGYRGKQFKTIFQGVLETVSSSHPQTQHWPLSSTIWWQFLTIWIPQLWPFMAPTDTLNAKVSFMHFKNLTNAKAPPPRLKFPEHKVSSHCSIVCSISVLDYILSPAL